MSQLNRSNERQPSKQLGALSGLLPFLLPYKGLIAASCLALIITAGLSLVLPLAVRRVIDTFENGNENILDLYFAAILVVAALLAAGTAIRYALGTKLGERVVTDIRETIFKRVLKMSPQFLDCRLFFFFGIVLSHLLSLAVRLIPFYFKYCYL